jgi:hypothetical protein
MLCQAVPGDGENIVQHHEDVIVTDISIMTHMLCHGLQLLELVRSLAQHWFRAEVHR